MRLLRKLRCLWRQYHEATGFLARSQWYSGDFLGWRCDCGAEFPANERADVIHAETMYVQRGKTPYTQSPRGWSPGRPRHVG